MTVAIGVTGTRYSATRLQLRMLMGTLLQYYQVEPVDFHHGACVGVDHQAALIAQALGFHVVAHPPENPKYRSQLALDISRTIMPELGYLERDRAIVHKTQLLIALPQTSIENPRSGTWYTYKYALQQNKTTILILPDGSTK